MIRLRLPTPPRSHFRPLSRVLHLRSVPPSSMLRIALIILLSLAVVQELFAQPMYGRRRDDIIPL